MINKVMRAALKALSYPDIDIEHNYQLGRKVINATHMHILKPFYTAWDHEVKSFFGGEHCIPVRIFSPDDSHFHPIIIFFHGGGWVTGNIDTYDRVCCDIARLTGRIIISVDYRLAPEYRFPAGLEDCYSVVAEVFANLDIFGVNRTQVTIMGDSAGGNLAAAVSLMARDRGEFAIDSQILLYPATYNDHSASSPFPSIVENGTDFLLTSKKISDYLTLYRSKVEDLDNPYFAPLLCENLTNQPKTLIITAQFDPLRDEGEAFSLALRDEGNYVEYYCIPDALHGFFSLPSKFVHVRDAYDLINQFLDDVTDSICDSGVDLIVKE